MMIKEAAAKGEPFAYEAEVLDLLARGDEKISQPVAEIVKYAPQGIKSKKTLTDGLTKFTPNCSNTERRVCQNLEGPV